MSLCPVSVDTIASQIGAGNVIPYLGPGMLALCPDARVPETPDALAQIMTARVSVPHKIRNRLTQAAQFIENFKHRKSVVSIMNEAFASAPTPSALHRALAASGAGLYVDCWYDDTFATALANARPPGCWVQVQGLSQSEHFGQWFGAYDASGAPLADVPAAGALLYRPIGARAPAANYLVSDSDYVEVLTEIDIQTPIPAAVQAWRTGRSFLFLGCRFDDQLARSFARQIMKRSSDTHWAVLPDEPTRMEARFLDEQRITRIAMPLAAFADELVSALQPALAA
ncbi:SIR2 family NAD-dependent protein deacylase [Paraburkholderia heleia]|uniref:SIR2 family NAD-dependent protein deacylase n=1 Tax=Paraburkholderia heleia TaxID=634127 RepID=UPI0005AAF4C9|nr:SIR2 family protein [Paraburkholderia heleia]